MPSEPYAGVPTGNEPTEFPVLLDALRAIHDPCSAATGIPINIVDMGLIGTLSQHDGTVTVGLCLTSPACWQATGLMAAIETALLTVDAVQSVSCVFDPTHEWMPDRMDPAAQARLRAVRPLPLRNRKRSFA